MFAFSCKKLLCGTLLFLVVPFCSRVQAENLTYPYSLSLKTDLPLSFFAAAFSVYGSYQYGKMEVPEEDEVFRKSRLLPWDRSVAGRYDETCDRVSDYAAVLGVAPFVLGGVSLYRGDIASYDFATYSLMLMQALAIQNGLNLLVRSMELWPRPYVYGEDGDALEKASEAKGEAYGSFFSGHASAAFTIATFTGSFFSEVYPNSCYKGVVWASSLSAAGLVGVLRIAAGKHYPTDVVAGALVGVGVSFSILEMHKKTGDRISLYTGLNSVGLLGRF